MIIQLKGCIETDTLVIAATLSVKIPIWGSVDLAQVHGSLNDGVSVNFGISGILSGTARVYLKSKFLWIDLSANVFGTANGPITISLISLP